MTPSINAKTPKIFGLRSLQLLHPPHLLLILL